MILMEYLDLAREAIDYGIKSGELKGNVRLTLGIFAMMGRMSDFQSPNNQEKDERLKVYNPLV